jgi:hypothetical protein
MEGEVAGDAVGPESAGIFLFIEQLDFTHPDPVIIEIEILRIVDGVAQFYFLPDIGGGNFIERTLETDCGVVVDHAFMADEKDLIEFRLGESADGDPLQGGMVTLDGFFPDTGVDFVMIVLLEPKREGLV